MATTTAEREAPTVRILVALLRFMRDHLPSRSSKEMLKSGRLYRHSQLSIERSNCPAGL